MTPESNPNTQKRYTGTVTYEQISIQNNASEDKYFDGDNSSEVWLAKGPYENPGRDTIPAGATLTVTFPEPKTNWFLPFGAGSFSKE